MKKKLIGICVCMLIMGTMLSSVVGQITIPSNISENGNEIITHRYITDVSSYPTDEGIDEYIINQMSTYHIPGLSATIIRDDSVFWTKSYGYANISEDKLVENTTVFYLASVSKTITLTAIMQLYEQGNFELDDSINDYLPFEVHNPTYPDTNITFLMLMTHTSSIKDNPNYVTEIEGDPTIPLEEFLEEYFTPGGAYYDPVLNFYPNEPGTYYAYSNPDVGLLALIVEILSNESFPEYCETNIFEPLDMPETAWFLADLNISNIAVPYLWTGGDYVPYNHYHWGVYPGANLRSSVTQLRHFLLMMMNGGVYNSTQILLEDTVDLICTEHWSNFIGLIWWKLILNGRIIWCHPGATKGCRTTIAFEPATNIGVIVLTNSANEVYDDIVMKLFDFAEAPYPPDIDGPASGRARKPYDYEFTTTDPDADAIYYFIDWGDGSNSSWLGPYNSGEPITISHTWTDKDNYMIKARAKDVNNNEGDWGYLEVSMPKNTGLFVNHPILSWLLMRFPNMFPMVRYIMNN